MVGHTVAVDILHTLVEGRDLVVGGKGQAAGGRDLAVEGTQHLEAGVAL